MWRDARAAVACDLTYPANDSRTECGRPSPETSPALRWPDPEPGPEECDTSRCTDGPETWSLSCDCNSLHCSWTCDPATETYTGETCGRGGGTRRCSTRDLRAYLHFPYMVPLQALDHLLHLVLHASLMCLRHLCLLSQSRLKSIKQSRPGSGRTYRIRVNAVAELLYFIRAKVTSIQAWSKMRRGLHHFRFTSVVSLKK